LDFIQPMIRCEVVNHALPEKDNRVTHGPQDNSKGVPVRSSVAVDVVFSSR
jgi:hypothetical protein